MWLITTYEATSLFTLKPATATASGGKTLLVPTPFAIKMALLDVACKLNGQRVAEESWDWLCRLRVAIRPADEVIVNNTFIKVLKPRRNPAEPGSQDEGFFGRTITYREFAHLGGEFKIALQTDPDTNLDLLKGWLVCINYLGKRGSFIQMVTPPQEADELAEGFVEIGDSVNSTISFDSILTQLDDTSETVTFEQVNIYSGKRLSLGKDRVLHHVALPYQQVASSRSYTYYKRKATS